jgi:general L-amino acid transport system substrate-binding protein
MKIMTLPILAATALALGAVSAHAGTLDDVKAKGFVQCGTTTGLLGFAAPDDAGNWSGFDVDFCRAVAAAIFNDPQAVKFTPLTAAERFTALQSGEVDLLARNTTWTMTRDTSLGLTFAGVTYYDGQGFMVPTALGVSSALELAGASVCVQTGTTTELNMADFFKRHGMDYNPVVFEKQPEVNAAYDTGRCDVYTTDASGLYSVRLTLTNPELGVTSANVDQMRESENQDVRRLLGTDGEFGTFIGLGNDWAANTIKAVGNYGEIFERNIGVNTPLKIARGLNALWSNGGLQYAPPIR